MANKFYFHDLQSAHCFWPRYERLSHFFRSHFFFCFVVIRVFHLTRPMLPTLLRIYFIYWFYLSRNIVELTIQNEFKRHFSRKFEYTQWGIIKFHRANEEEEEKQTNPSKYKIEKKNCPMLRNSNGQARHSD